MLLICEDRLRQLNLERDPNIAAAQGQSSNALVEADITRLLEGKSFDQLLALENNVKSKLASREPIDVDYWEGLLRSLQVWKAKVGHARDLLRRSAHYISPNQLEQAASNPCCRHSEQVGATAPEATYSGSQGSGGARWYHHQYGNRGGHRGHRRGSSGGGRGRGNRIIFEGYESRIIRSGFASPRRQESAHCRRRRRAQSIGRFLQYTYKIR